jgi:OFA family oxalate/formate antiporter-like MFS transporter
MKKGKYSALIAAVFLQLCIGVYYVWSIFQGPVMKLYGWTTAQSSATFSVMLAVNVGGMILGGWLNHRKGPRFSITAGWIIFIFGLLMSSFVPVSAPWLMYVSFGGLVAGSVGIVYVTIIAVVQRWWQDKKGVAAGVTAAAFGAATVVLTPVVNWLVSDSVLGVAWTFRALAIAFTVVFLAAVWFIKDPSKEYMDSFAHENPSLALQRQLKPSEIVRTKEYYLVLGIFICLPPAYYILNPLIKQLGELRGLPEALAMGSVMITGVASVIGRFTAPALSDVIGLKKVLYLLFAVMFVSSLLMAMAQGFLFIVLIALIAYAYGGWTGVIPVTTVELFGAKHLDSNYGIVMVTPAFSGVVFPAIANLLSVDGVPAAFTFLVPAAGCIIGFIVGLKLRIPGERRKERLREAAQGPAGV